MRGLMQDVPLSMELVLRRLRRHARGRRVVTGTATGDPVRLTWEEVAERAARLRGALPGLGVRPGDRVATFARNTHRHVELLLGVPAAGAVLCPLNPRLFEDQLAWVAGHSGARVLFVDAGLTATLAPVRERLTGVERFVLVDNGEEPASAFADEDRYDALLDAAEPDRSPVAVDERDALALCYTSGTTGNPKGVLFSHRSTVLHALSATFVDNHAVSREDTVLPVTAVCHVLSWGLPYAAALTGADLVVQGPSNAPEHLAALIESERVTKAAGVPTLWVEMEPIFDGGERDLSSLRELLVGGAPVPRALIRRYRARGVKIAQGWGMSEMSPSGTMARETGEGEGASKQGTAMALVELRLVDGDGAELPWDGRAVGELEVRGPCVASGYYRPDDPAVGERFSADGWLRTGDLARVDADGTVEIVDRAKDLVKSGGEWISSVELEGHLTAHPDVVEAAVIAVPHPKWGERPLAVVVARPGTELGEAQLVGFLRTRVATWWVPDTFTFVDAIPRTAVGKLDKRELRARYASAEAMSSG